MIPDNELELTYILPVYVQNEHSQDLADLIKQYEGYSKAITDKIQFIIVDDCSPIPVKPVQSTLNIKIVRISEDIPWNQPGARNLGVMLAKTSKLILTDLDHRFNEKLLSKILEAALPRHLFKFKRKRNNEKVRSHPNTFFCTKAVFYKALGYDEAFCGHYGFDDVFFIELQKALGTSVKYFSWTQFVEHLEHSDGKKETQQHFLSRDTGHNQQLLEKKMQILKSGNPLKAHSRKFLGFNYEIVV